MSATATFEIDRAPDKATTRSRVGALAGVAFALCLFLGVASLEVPDGASDRELVAWWSDGGHQTTAVASMYLFVLAGLCFLVFVVKLRSRPLAAEGARGELTALAVAGGVVFVAMLFVAAASRGLIGFAVKSPARRAVRAGSRPGPRSDPAGPGDAARERRPLRDRPPRLTHPCAPFASSRRPAHAAAAADHPA